MTVPASMRAHAAINGLVTLVKATLPDATVIDGPRRAEEVGLEVVLIGWDLDLTQSVVEERGGEDMCGRMTAQGAIACRISVLDGDADMTAARGRATELLESIETAVRADQAGLSGAVDSAAVGPDLAMQQAQTDQGATVALSFSVSYEAFV